MESNTILTKKYSTTVKKLHDKVLFFERHHTYDPPQTEVDTFGDFWVFGWADVPNEGVQFSHWNQQKLTGKTLIIVPPFSVVEWKILCKELNWSAYIWPGKLMNISFAKPFIHHVDNFDSVQSWEHAIRFLQTITPVHTIEKNATKDPLAMKAKKLIDSRLGDDLSITELALELQCSAPLFTRIFKRTFGLTPVDYRNKLRIYSSMFQLLVESNKNISDIGFETGFADLSRFNKAFKKYTLTTPKEFIFR